VSRPNMKNLFGNANPFAPMLMPPWAGYYAQKNSFTQPMN